MIYTSCANAKPQKLDGKYITAEFIGLTKRFILQELFNINQEHTGTFGEMVICLDESSNGYWRKDFYSGYKEQRKRIREESEINFGEVFAEINLLVDQIATNLPWKVVCVDTAEADDIMLVLSKEFSKTEKILIHSPDKDMLQAQRDPNVFQYSSLTKKWMKPETKNSSMDEWITEHVCLGDTSDNVPKVVDFCEFSSSFLEYLKGLNLDDIETPMDFKKSELVNDHKKNILENFTIFKTNRKGESTGVLDIYKDTRFGPTNLKKEIKKHGTVDAWLDSHPLYRKHYERNFTLVMSEGIPENIRGLCISNYKSAPVDYNQKEFETHLSDNDLKTVLLTLPGVFPRTSELTAGDFDW